MSMDFEKQKLLLKYIYQNLKNGLKFLSHKIIKN